MTELKSAEYRLRQSLNKYNNKQDISNHPRCSGTVFTLGNNHETKEEIYRRNERY